MSLKGDKYENTEEVKFRLENTIVLYEKKPVYIVRVQIPEPPDVNEIARVYFNTLPLAFPKADKEVRKYLSSKNFDLAPFKMGYYNDGGRATFISRAPVRQNRQGLCQNTSIFTNCMGKRIDSDFSNIIRSQGFVDMYHDKYPSFQEAGDLLGDEEHSSVAISKSFAFWIDHDLESLFLLHKGIKCGLATKNDKALKVPPKFHFLKEELEESRIPLA